MQKKTNLELFTELSVEATGISKEILAPAVSNYDLVGTYYNESIKKFGDYFMDKLLNRYEQYGLTKLDIEPYEEMVQQITFLWYMGAWAVETSFGVQTRTISAIAYQKGMSWQVMQSHPMGYSVSRYGYWAHLPGDLEAYVGN